MVEKEPIYYCMNCEKVLTRAEQGTYTYCRECRLLWDSAFMAGFQHAKDLLNVGSIVQMKNLMDDLAPYRVR